MSTSDIKRSTFNRQFWQRVALWAVIGAAFGIFAADRIEGLASHFTVSQGIAMAIAWVYALPGLFILVASLSPRLGISMKVFADHEAWEDERAIYANSGIGSLLISLILLALLAVEPLGVLTAGAGTVLVVALLAVSSWFTWRTWTGMDELWRRVTSEATVWSYYLIFVPGAAWSGAAHLGLVQPMGALDWLSLFLGATMVGSVIATARRGLIEDA
jgi:hypothetical protein